MNVLFNTASLTSTNYSKKVKSSLLDFIFIVLFYTIAITGIRNSIPLPNYLYTIIHYIWLASPLPLAYISLRLLRTPSLISAYTVFMIFKLLDYISNTKLSLTGEVLPGMICFPDLIYPLQSTTLALGQYFICFSQYRLV